MAVTVFKDTTFSVSLLVESIQRGEVALPDIQRPFVWQATKVRDLLDSMYKGFPVGYLLFWETGAEAGARQIGTDTKQAVPRLLIVDGQQRLTSLYAVMTATPIVREDYSSSRIRIAFRPADATFAVADAAVEKDPEFLTDVSVLWGPEKKNAIRAYLARLGEKRPLTQQEIDELEDSIDRLFDLRTYQFKVVELSPEVDEEEVAEVFVRINSEGVTLNQADFILTLMSVFWDKGRRDLENFCRAGKTPSLSGASPFNWFIQPQPAQLIRVSVALAFRRGVLRQVYTLLRGKDPDTGKLSAEKRDAQFERLQSAQERVLDLTNWHEFLLCVERAGFRSSKMISSDNALILSYALWLIGRVDHRVPISRLREVIARWFFMAHSTARYSGSFESQLERDLAQLRDVSPGDADGYVATLSQIVDDTLTNDYWSITLPNELATSASKSPALMAYIAALNILDADALLSTGKVRSRLDPAVIAKKGIERHHLFPRGHLKKTLRVSGTKQINQIANMALVEWNDNIAISDDPPSEYWPDQIAAKKIGADTLARQMYWHALPDGWTELSYPEFLAERRRRMAAVVRDAFAKLGDVAYEPVYPAPTAAAPAGPAATTPSGHHRIIDLVAAGLLPVGTILTPTVDLPDVAATVDADGRVLLDGEAYETPSAAAHAAKGEPADGWTFWLADTPEGQRTLAAVRDEYAVAV